MARRRALLGALAAVVVLAGAALFVVLSRDEVSALEATRLTVDPIPVAAAPVGLAAADDGTPWVLTTDGEVGFVRPIEDDKAGDELMLDDPAYSLASTGRDLWATTQGGVARIDPAARQVLGGPVDLESGSGSEIASGEGALWVSDTIDNGVIRADPETARAVGDPIEVGATMRTTIVAGEGAVWVLRGDADIDADLIAVVPIDPANNQAGHRRSRSAPIRAPRPSRQEKAESGPPAVRTSPVWSGSTPPRASSTRAACPSRTASRPSPSATARSGSSTARG